MNLLSDYLTVAKASEVVQIERKSKFIGRAKPVDSVEEAELFIAEISKEHWDATHNVYAYIIGPEGEHQKCSDDGEPSGTSGLPTLEAIKNLNLINVVVVVTRYFGGVLLGRGGLIRAYGGAAKAALEAAGILRCVVYQRVKVVVDYTLVGKVQNELINSGVLIHNTEYLADVTFTVDILPDQIEQIYQSLQNLSADNFKWDVGEQVYHQFLVQK